MAPAQVSGQQALFLTMPGCLVLRTILERKALEAEALTIFPETQAQRCLEAVSRLWGPLELPQQDTGRRSSRSESPRCRVGLAVSALTLLSHNALLSIRGLPAHLFQQDLSLAQEHS